MCERSGVLTVSSRAGAWLHSLMLRSFNEKLTHKKIHNQGVEHCLDDGPRNLRHRHRKCPNCRRKEVVVSHLVENTAAQDRLCVSAKGRLISRLACGFRSSTSHA